MPRIRGDIVGTPTGSRVDVWLFMHPLAFTYMLVWFALVASAQWRVLDDDIARSYLPLGLMVLGLMLSLGVFFYEALKVVPMLSEAIFNPAIAAASEPFPESVEAADVGHRDVGFIWRRAIVLVLALVSAGALASLLLYERLLRSSPVFVAATELVSRSANVGAMLGQPIETGPRVRGLVTPGGYAALAIPVAGPAGSGTLYVVANRVKTDWDIERAVLVADVSSDGVTRLDLTPFTKREAFSYPAPGRVYLQPLDAASAEELKDLPAYYKARLDLEVVVLPTRTLGPETVEPGRNQLLAEKAIIAMGRANPEIVSDVDAVVLGVTSQDLNIQTAGWDFAVNYRLGRFGIVSTARLHRMPWLFGGNPAVYPVRVRKMVTKNLALLRYPLGLSSDPTSALAWTANTTAEVDRMASALRASLTAVRRTGRTGRRASPSSRVPEDNRAGGSTVETIHRRTAASKPSKRIRARRFW